MRWTPGELHEIAGFLAKRFPDRSRSDWQRTVEDHAERDALHVLVRSCADRIPEDDNLVTLVEVVSPPTSSRRRLLAYGTAAGLALGLAAAFLAALARPAFMEDPVMADTSPAPPPLQPQSIEPDTPPEVEALQPQPMEALQPQSIESDNGPRVRSTMAVEPGSAGVASGDLVPSDRCRSGAGVIGYWYAGDRPPGAAGEVIEVPRDVNVRTDYPDRHNGYDSRSSVRCVLRAGDRVRLDHDPIFVPGDVYWVPLTAGSVLEAAS